MTAEFDPVADPDDRPAPHAGVAPAPVRTPARHRPSGWARAFRWWLALSALAFVGIAVCAFIGLHQVHGAPLHIVIDGDDLADGLTINGLSEGGRALVAVAAGLAALLLVMLIPLLLFLVVGSLAVALVCGVAVPLAVLALALAVGTSPIWLVGLLVWLTVRRRESHRLAASATMAA